MSTKGVQPSYALPVLGRNTSDRFRVNGIETPGNGLLVDAALGESRFNQYVPVLCAGLARVTY